MTAARLYRLPQRHPERIEVRAPDFAGHLVGMAEVQDDHWLVYPDLTDCPRARATVAGALVREAYGADEAEQILRGAWPEVAL